MTVGSFFINYCVENGGYTDAEASNLLSYALIVFTVGRFFGTGLAHFLQTDIVLFIYAIIAVAFAAYISAGQGHAAVGVLISLYFFQSLMYPSIFVLGTANLGPHTRRGAGILVMGVSGGAVFPPIQGAIADNHTTRISYVVPMVGYLVVGVYAAYHWITHGFKIKRDRQVTEVIVVPTPGQKKSSIFVSNDPLETIIEHQRKRSGIDAFKRLEEGNFDMTPVNNSHASEYTDELVPPTATF